MMAYILVVSRQPVLSRLICRLEPTAVNEVGKVIPVTDSNDERERGTYIILTTTFFGCHLGGSWMGLEESSRTIVE